MTKTKAQQIMAATEVRAADDVTAAIRDIAAEFEPYIIKQRRHFHKHPELSLAEERTTSDIANQLDAMNIPYERPLKTGLVATLRGTAPDAYREDGTPRRRILLRADIDALPVTEQTGEEFASVNEGCMHACGHDAHTTCLLGAAKVLSAHRADFGGEVRFLFQPAEEIGQGARPLIAAGMLDGAQRVFGLHTASDLPTGTVGVKPGANNAGVDHFIIRIHGKSAHVSTPQLGVDALYIASELVVALQSIVTRMTSPVEPVLIGVGKLNAGTAYNAVAETAVLEGTTRMFSPESRAHLRETINAAAAHISALYGGTAEVEWDDFATPLTNDASVCGEVERVADALGIPTTANRALSLSGDDFAEYLLQTKGAYAYLGTANPKKPHTCISNHRGDFDIDEETLPLGAALYAAYALSVLDPQFAK